MEKILVIDEGTTSTRAMLIDAAGECLGVSQRELTQYYPRPGFVEHDAEEIWTKTLDCARDMVALAGGAGQVAAIGITNQRETVLAWDKGTGKPLSRAIVWQDRRTAGLCADLKAAGHEPDIQAKTGLLLDPYFSGSKIRWLLENVEGVRRAGPALAFGTIESWLIFKLTGGLHVSDASNASRTMLMALDGMDWDPALLDLFTIPRGAMPEIVDCAGDIATTDAGLFGAPIRICGAAGDQQAATIGQGCLAAGDTKATFGTGAFILASSGETIPRSRHRLLTTVLCQVAGRRLYALEGSLFVAGSLIKWLRDELGLLASAEETAALAAGVTDNGGVYFVPSLAGLGAPHWIPESRGQLTGLSFATTRGHIARAALESMAHMASDLKATFAADGVTWSTLWIDGGMSSNDWMAHDLANMLDVPVGRPDFVETTALGVAMLASVGAGLHATLEDAVSMRGAAREFLPRMSSAYRSFRLAGWEVAMRNVVATAEASRQ